MLLSPRAALSSVVVAMLAAAAPLSAQNADLLADCNPSSSDAGDYLDHEYTHTESGDNFATELGIRSVIAAPILGESGAVGAIEIYARRPHAFVRKALEARAAGGRAAAGSCRATRRR